MSCWPASWRWRWSVRTLRRPAGVRNAGDGHLRSKIIDALPYALTKSQRDAVAAITEDLRQPVRMLRLVQGDVGSGKTVVALLAAAAVAEAGKQAALMAPTEILARQHIKTIAPLAERAGMRVAILTGREKGKERREFLARLEAGEIDLLVGTHALIQDDVIYKDLALAVVDEQHRFGVRERLALTYKGEAVDVLVLSATPIPRTLVLTYFGDMDVSELREKPAGRQPIDTRAVPMSRLERCHGRRRPRARSAGKLVYWICPLVEEVRGRGHRASRPTPTERFETLQKRFGDQRRPRPRPDERRREGPRDGAVRRAARSASWSRPRWSRSASTCRAATIMVIENAERFGLAQLHQLRGRIGRGSEASTCLLLYKEPLGEMSKARLKVIRETTDGFRIAEEDLKLRGEGDVLGIRQSGLPGYRIARSDVHAQLITQARDEALRIMKDNPEAERRARRGAALPALPVRTRRSRAADRGGVSGLLTLNRETRRACSPVILRSCEACVLEGSAATSRAVHPSRRAQERAPQDDGVRALSPASALLHLRRRCRLQRGGLVGDAGGVGHAGEGCGALLVGSAPGCTTPPDMISVAASSVLISISMILLFGT